MLCSLCEKFTVDILQRDFSTWRKVNSSGLHTFKHGSYCEISASADAGCKVCGLLHTIREKRMLGYSSLEEKWRAKWASIDAIYQDEDGVPSFKLITVAPEKPYLEFEFFRLSSQTGLKSATFPALPQKVPCHSAHEASLAQGRQWVQTCKSNHSCHYEVLQSMGLRHSPT